MQKKTQKKLDPTKQMVLDLQNGGRFWETMKQIIQENIDYLTTQILENDELSDADRYDLRKWRKLNVRLTKIPEEVIESIRQGKVSPIDFDPYFKTYAELRGSKIQDIEE